MTIKTKQKIDENVVYEGGEAIVYLRRIVFISGPFLGEYKRREALNALGSLFSKRPDPPLLARASTLDMVRHSNIKTVVVTRIPNFDFISGTAEYQDEKVDLIFSMKPLKASIKLVVAECNPTPLLTRAGSIIILPLYDSMCIELHSGWIEITFRRNPNSQRLFFYHNRL